MPSDDPDDGVAFNADGAEGPADDRSGKRRTRLRLALAALPLAVAVALFAITGHGSGPAPVRDTASAEDSTMRGVPSVPSASALASEATGLTGPPSAQDAAAAAGVLPGLDVAETGPGRGIKEGGVAEGSVGADSVNADGPEADGTEADDGTAASTVLAAPSGHRPVALRIADPAALSLVAVGSHVDVVGMDGTVLAERLEVLKDRSPGMGSVVVLAVPDSAAPALAADALSREVTVILSG